MEHRINYKTPDGVLQERLFDNFNEFADSSVNFVVRPWVKASDYWGVYFDMHEAVKKRFDAENVSIPFPQRDVHLFQQNA